MKPTLRPDHVEIEQRKNDDGGTIYIVAPHFADVDRPRTMAYSCGTKLKLAQRLQKAFLDGVLTEDLKKHYDVDGKSYVSYFFPIRMRCANADLRKMGY